MACIKVVFAVVLGFSLLVEQGRAAQNPCGEQDTSSAKGTRVEQLINPEGWTIPGLEGGQQLDKRVADSQPDPDVTVYLRTIKAGKYKPVRLTEYETTSQAAVLVIKPSPFIQIISSIERYEANGHVFAYVVRTHTAADCGPASEYAKARAKARKTKGAPPVCLGVLSCGLTYLKYYDNDGDGKFETLEVTRGDGFTIPTGLSKEQRAAYMADHRFIKVPSWVKTKSSVQTSTPVMSPQQN